MEDNKRKYSAIEIEIAEKLLEKGFEWVTRDKDDEPVRLRDIVSWPLTDEERDWLRTVVKPFRDSLKAIEVHNGAFYGRYITFVIAHPEKWRDDIGEDVEYGCLPIPEDWFKGVEDHKKYTPEDLDI